jgi:uncharacterized membrane protein YeaQ/YmgE (transglycosylase-associated protein family)
VITLAMLGALATAIFGAVTEQQGLLDAIVWGLYGLVIGGVLGLAVSALRS